MRISLRELALLIPFFMITSGCGNIARNLLPNFALFDDNVTSQGAQPLLERDVFEKIDLFKEIGSPTEELANAGVNTDDIDRENLARAFKWFNEGGGDKRRRNGIQERIIAASNQRCGEYKNFLRQFEAEGNFFLGTATTTLAGLGAVFTPAATVRALAGAAAITSGIRAEFQEDFFYTLATHVITEGIDAKREEIYKALGKRQDEEVIKYTIQAAVNDAVQYHSACTTIVGLQAASEAIRQAKNPGLERLIEIKGGIDKLTGQEIKLTLSVPNSIVGRGEKLALIAKGGKPPYTFSISNEVAGSTITPNASKPGEATLNAGSALGKIVAKVKDLEGKIVGVTIMIQDIKAPIFTISETPLEVDAENKDGKIFDETVRASLKEKVKVEDDDGQTKEANILTPPKIFPLNTPTEVRFSATDSAGNISTKNVSVIAKDKSAPTITSLSDLAVEAENKAGTPSTNSRIQEFLQSGEGTDKVDGKVIVQATNVPDIFPIGTTSVKFTTKDAAGNPAEATANLIVQDTTPPVVTPPSGDLTLETNNQAGIKKDDPRIMEFLNSATANDAIDGELDASPISSTPEVFPLGTKLVTFEARDSKGNTGNGTARIFVNFKEDGS